MKNKVYIKTTSPLLMDKKIYDYAIDKDIDTERQFRECYMKDFVTAAALMPDAHSGYVAPIGSVLVTKDYVVPAWVGFDIGCGLIAVKISAKDKDLVKLIREKQDKIYDSVMKSVPMGLGKSNSSEEIHDETKKRFDDLIDKFKKGPHTKQILNILQTAAPKFLGTLGSGNHFIELSHYNEKELWLVIHSGSRGIGHKVATIYMQRASNSKEKYEVTFPLRVDSEEGKEYLNILDFCLEYALLNRLEMAYRVFDSLKKVLEIDLKMNLWVNKNHNHAIFERRKYIHRKGATPAKKGERGVIPANMRDGSFLVEGLGNPKFLHSSSHGAGRKLSRSMAKTKFTMTEFKKQMEGIKGTVNPGTIDEAPEAYKNIYDVMDVQKSSVKIVKHLKPLINWKG